MRKILWLFLLVAAALPALAQPEQVVRRLYTAHKKFNSLKKTVNACRDCFTPNFYNLFLQSLKTPPDGGDFLDYDFLINSQDEWIDFQVGKASYSGVTAVVPITVWLGQPSHGRDPGQTTTRGNIYLSRQAGKYQIFDIKHGKEGRSVREDLKGIVEANRKK
ncbi:MAG: DUF3828 domain-containing protein [Candidatus Eremiobacteraeota bacterium]|nr:DUF3828 domain-containing protein [Candidatus Eremiobacteraeota bacterium]MCW5866854.1 DUF3828 domain-containing protein [Candidatus Eremiobacteraeota bacterium]